MARPLLFFSVMSPSRILLYLAVACVIVGSGVAVADAMVVTDEERLQSFVDDLVEENGDRLQAALFRTDPNREPVDVDAGRRVRRYGEGEEAGLEEALRDALEPFAAAEIDLIQRSIVFRDENATVAVRIETPEGMADARFDLRRHGDRWLIRRLSARH